MEPLSRVIKYVDFGYSAERVAELMDWPVEQVRAVKGARAPQQIDLEDAIAEKEKVACSPL